jgi:hypothetical protein
VAVSGRRIGAVLSERLVCLNVRVRIQSNLTHDVLNFLGQNFHGKRLDQ